MNDKTNEYGSSDKAIAGNINTSAFDNTAAGAGLRSDGYAAQEKAPVKNAANKMKPAEDSPDKIHIADEVLSTIASLAIGKIPSVAPSSMSVGEGLAGFLGMKTSNKGIRIDSTEKNVSLEIYVTMEYGCKLHTAAKQLQDTVREDIEEMTGLKVLAVNVHILGVNLKELREQKALKDGKERDAKDKRDGKDGKDGKEGKGTTAELPDKSEIAAIVSGNSAASSGSDNTVENEPRG